MPRALKVYRTAIGFHDAYIAVPTKKAAIEAWGAGSDIFQRGEAEEVTESDLTAEPLASPGVVIKRLRGSSDDHMAALAATAPPANDASRSKPRAKTKSSKPSPTSKKLPSRAALDEAEAAIAAARKAHEEGLIDLIEREKALARERREREEKHRQEMGKLDKALKKVEARYQAAMEKWREQ